MKKQNLTYYFATVLFSLWMLKNAWSYLTSPMAIQLCIHFGLPDYLRLELAVAKVIGVAVLTVPIFMRWQKEWAYSGFMIVLISGIIAHLASDDPLIDALSVIPAAVLLLLSYRGYRQIGETNRLI